MKSNLKLIFPLFACWFTWTGQSANAQKPDFAHHPYDSVTVLTTPTLFGPGLVSTGDFDSHPAFTPDGKTLYFVRSTPTFIHWTILVTHFEKGRWSTPEVAPFSGQYSDADPFITSDGSRLYFISNRPVSGKATPDLDIWVMEKTAAGWSDPKNVGGPINSAGSEWYPTLTANGTIYFGSDREGGRGRTDIYRSRLVNDKYSEPENLGEIINTQFNEFEPLPAPDESFMIFMAGGRPDGRGGFDLYLTYQREGKWTKPTNLGDQINSPGNEYSPAISPNRKYFFWTSTRSFTDRPLEKRLDYGELVIKLRGPGNGLGDIYQIDISVLNIANVFKLTPKLSVKRLPENRALRLFAEEHNRCTDAVTGNYFAYDAMGRVIIQKQTTGSTTYGLAYAYNSAGLTSETYHSGRTVSYSYDQAARLSSVKNGATTFASGYQFTEHGLKSETFGN